MIGGSAGMSLQTLHQTYQVGVKQQRRILAEVAYAPGVLQEQQAEAVGEQSGIFAQGVFGIQTHAQVRRTGGRGARTHHAL